MAPPNGEAQPPTAEYRIAQAGGRFSASQRGKSARQGGRLQRVVRPPVPHSGPASRARTRPARDSAARRALGGTTPRTGLARHDGRPVNPRAAHDSAAADGPTARRAVPDSGAPRAPARRAVWTRPARRAPGTTGTGRTIGASTDVFRS
jgi:hypothetical protein